MSTPQEEPKDRPRTATAFEKELWVLQDDSPKTPVSAMGTAGCIVGLGVFVWVVFFGLRLFNISIEEFFRDSGTLLGIAGILLLILATLAPVIGAVLFVVALVRPKRSVKCPFCLTDHSVYKTVRSYVCTGCAAVLRMPSAMTTDELVKVICPNCQTSWATTPDAGALQCFGCGLPIKVNEGQAKAAGRSIACWSCKAKILDGLFFCHHCGCLVTEPPELPRYAVHIDLHEMVFKTLPATTSDGMDVISLRANSPIGFLIRALWRAQAVFNGMLVPAKTEKKFSLAEQSQYLSALDEAMDFLTEAITLEPSLAPAVQTSLPIYDACLNVFFARIEEKSQSQDFSLKAAYKEVLKTLPAKRNALQSRLDEMLNLQGGQTSFEKWPEPLFKVEESGNTVTVKDAGSVQSWASRLATPSQIGKIRIPEPALISLQSDRARLSER
ncbi:MAG: zinc ribbon domain-containing protein [Acidobacteriota bacterium]